MELREFVESALCQIAEAMLGAQARLAPLGVTVNPLYEKPSDNSEGSVAASIPIKPHVQIIKFDLAVTASSVSSRKGEAGINVLGIQLGGQKEGNEKGESVSRISFEIVLLHPRGKSGSH